MTRFKDWKEGEARFKVSVVTPDGAQLEYYSPHHTPDECLALCGLMNNMVSGGDEVVKAALRAIKKVDREGSKGKTRTKRA